MIEDKALVETLTRTEAVTLSSFMELLTLSAEQLANQAETVLAEQSKEPMPAALLNQYIRKDLSYEFADFTNAYLSSFLTRVLGRPVDVVGKMRKLEPCACCGYRTTKNEPGNICSVCFWECDKSVISLGISGPNSIPLSQAKVNFVEFGAVELRFLKYLHPDRISRYSR